MTGSEQPAGAAPAGGDFDDLVAQALAAPFTGWDFGWLNARSTVTSPAWNYQDEVLSRAASARTMLDMGTGGGEFLAALPRRPARTLATEGYPPNVPVAAARLRPLGVPVLHAESAPDNMSDEARAQQAGSTPGTGRLPCRDGALDLVINRHESFSAREVSRVLAPGGTFVTQQVDYRSDAEVYDLLGLDPPEEPGSWLPLAVAQLTAAGLTVTDQRAGPEVRYLRDVGALVYYLKAVPWVVPRYEVAGFLPRLRAIWRRGAWPAPVTGHRFLTIAVKPADPPEEGQTVGGNEYGTDG